MNIINPLHKRNHIENEEGFTLLELMIVAVIIGILAAIAIPIFANQQKSAAEATLKADLKNTALAMQTEATKTGGKYGSTIPAGTPVTDGNRVYLAYGSAGNNVASGQSGASGGVNVGRIGYHGSPSTTTTYSEDGAPLRTYHEDNYGGPYWDYVNSAGIVPAGTPLTVSVDIKSTTPNCIQHIIEQKHEGAGQTSVRNGQTCLQPNVWTKVSFTVTTTRDADYLAFTAYSNHLAGEVFSYKNPVMVLSNKIDETSLNAGAENKFCVEGYVTSDPANIWSYDILGNGLKKGKC